MQRATAAAAAQAAQAAQAAADASKMYEAQILELQHKLANAESAYLLSQSIRSRQGRGGGGAAERVDWRRRCAEGHAVAATAKAEASVAQRVEEAVKEERERLEVLFASKLEEELAAVQAQAARSNADVEAAKRDAVAVAVAEVKGQSEERLR